MGLLDSVLGAATGAAQGGEGPQSLQSLLGNQPQWLQVAGNLLGNDGELGGLPGLVAKFQQAGLGDVVASWVGKGENLPITSEQLSAVLGSDALSGMAGKLGLNPNELATQLSGLLPGLVDQLTPEGQVPAGGLGQGGDLLGTLGSLFKA